MMNWPRRRRVANSETAHYGNDAAGDPDVHSGSLRSVLMRIRTECVDSLSMVARNFLPMRFEIEAVQIGRIV
jgi:hypothetical protein